MCVSWSASAQNEIFYPTQFRPPNLKWLTLETPNFRIIYPTGDDSLARRAGMILENQYPSIQKLLDSEITKFPVVLNNYNDLSNGFVSSLNFRSEIETPPLKGKLLNPQSGDWYETVIPHELVHALHFEKKGGIPEIFRLFWPDAARSIHGFAPVGVHEGIAVHHESSNHVSPYGNGGRLNYPFFSNRFLSNFASNDRWMGGQVLISSDFTYPFNRHYVSGSHFTEWLHHKYGEEVSRRAIQRHYKAFYLGYGMALRNVTGKSPRKLITEYHADIEIEEEKRLASIPNSTTPNSTLIELPYSGIEVHRPLWINNNELLFTGLFYNARRGFYRYNTQTKKTSNFREHFTLEDFNYQLKDGKLVYASYFPDEIYDATRLADLSIYDFPTQKNRRLTTKKRLFAPAFYGDGIVALQTLNADNSIVFLDAEGNLEEEKIAVPNTRFISIKPNPTNPEEWVVLANKRGVQSIWISSRNDVRADLQQLPDIGFLGASIFDIFWHPTKHAFLFSSDRNGVLNVYEYDFGTETVTQLTQSYYNAFEASLSDDGNTLAYILQNGDERWLALLEKDQFYNRQVSSTEWSKNAALRERLNRPLLGAELNDEAQTWTVEKYKQDLGWLTPRAFLPIVEAVPGSNISRAGLQFLSGDVLSSHSLTTEISAAQNRAWWEIEYNNKSFFPGLTLEAFSRPSFTRFNVRATNLNTGQSEVIGPFTNVIQRRGFSVSVPLRYRLSTDNRFTSFLFRPQLNLDQFRFFELSGSANSDFTNRFGFESFSQFNFRLLQLPRDFQPSSGLVFFTQYETTFNDASVTQVLMNDAQRIEINRGFTKPSALLLGTFLYASPLRKYNQSLRLDFRMLTQTEDLVFNTESLVPLGFDEDIFDNQDNNTIRFSTRYVIPLLYPDKGGLLVPAYVSGIYLTGFTHTLGNYSTSSPFSNPRTIVGGGLRFRFKLSNLIFDIGAGFAFEPSRNQANFIVGEF